MKSPSFRGSSATEDPKNFIEELKRVFDLMNVAEVERVELVVYQMKGVVRIWFDKWKKNRVEDALVVSWDVFEISLLGSFFPRELREAKIREFFTLNPECINVHGYNLKFTQLSFYALKVVVLMRNMMSLFVTGWSCQSSKEGKTTMLIGDMNLARFYYSCTTS